MSISDLPGPTEKRLPDAARDALSACGRIGRAMTARETDKGATVITPDEKPQAEAEQVKLGIKDTPATGRLMKQLSELECELHNVQGISCYMGDIDSEHELELIVTGTHTPTVRRRSELALPVPVPAPPTWGKGEAR